MHILCLGITPDDHDWLQAHADDVEVVAHYLHEREITCALAHPFYAVEAPLLPRHRRRLAQLFDIWEVRNGSRARELNHPAAIYVETHGGTGVGGSDDHAGVDIGRTWSATPDVATPQEFLAHVRGGRVSAHGEQGSAAKWAHAAMALAIRALGRGSRRRRSRSGGGAADGRARDDGGRRPQRLDRLRPRSRGRPSPAARVARRSRPAHERARPARPPAVRRLLARRPRAPRAPRPRAPPAARGGDRGRRPVADRRRGRRSSSPPASPRSPTRPRPPSSGARRASWRRARASRCGSRWSPTGSAGCTASRTRSTRSASAACPASRSR